MTYFAYFSFSTIHLELKRQIRLYAPVVPLKTIPDLRPQWSKSIPVFRPKRLKNHTLWGGTYLYSLYRGVPPGGGGAIVWWTPQLCVSASEWFSVEDRNTKNQSNYSDQSNFIHI